MFLRDAKQAEVLLNQQETFLSKEDVPVRTLYIIFRSYFLCTTHSLTYHAPWVIIYNALRAKIHFQVPAQYNLNSLIVLTGPLNSKPDKKKKKKRTLQVR